MKKILLLFALFGFLNSAFSQCTSVYNSAYQPTTSSGFEYSQGWNLFTQGNCIATNYHLEKFIIQVSDDNISWSTYSGGYTWYLGTSSPSNQSNPFNIPSSGTGQAEAHFNFNPTVKGKYFKIYFDIYSPSSNTPLNPLSGGRLWTSFFVPNINPPITKPNLTHLNPIVPNNANTGSNITVSISVLSNGTAQASGSKIKYYISNFSTFSISNAQYLGISNVNSLYPSNSQNITKTLSLSGVSSGNKYIHFVIDADNDVNEIYENYSDNITSSYIYINAGSTNTNLTPTNTNLSTLVNQGTNFWVNFRTYNTGTNSIPSNTITTAIYFSYNNILDASDDLLGTKSCTSSISSNSNGCYHSQYFTNTLPSGTYYMIYKTDINNNVFENNENDNIVVRSFTVRVPCLAGGPPTSFTPNVTDIIEGQTVDLNNTSTNYTSNVWNIDNSSTSTNISLSNIQLDEPGSAPITLTSFDACNKTNEQTEYVKVHPIKDKTHPLDACNGSKSQSARDCDPVDIGTGAFVTKLNIFDINHTAGTSSIALYYTSTSNENNVFGNKWSADFNVKLEILEKRYIVHYEDGHNDYYVRYHDYTAEPLYNGILDTFIINGLGGSYTVKKPNGTEYLFTSGNPPSLYQIKDRYNNSVYFSNYPTYKIIDFPGGRWVKYYYDTNNNIERMETNDGRNVYFTVDANGDLVQFTNVAGDVMNMTYDASHNMLTKTDFKGTTILTNIYDFYGRVVEQTDAHNEKYTNQYNTPTNDATTVINPDNTQKIYYHDNYMQHFRTTDELNYNTYTGYNNTLHQPSSFTDEGGNISIVSLDNQGNPLSFKNALGDSTLGTYGLYNLPTTFRNMLNGEIQFTRDALGNPTTTLLPNGATINQIFSNKGQVLSYTTANSYLYSMAYNSQGDLTKLTTPTGDITYTRDTQGRVTHILDRESKTTELVWDSKNLIEVIDAKNKSAYASYDANDNLLFVTNRTNDTTFYTYDLRDRLVKITNALNQETEFIYDVMDRLIERKDALGNSVYYDYNDRGELTSVENDLGTTFYNYFPSGDLSSVVTPMGNSYSFTYDALHRQVTTTNPLGESTTTSYNKESQVSSHTNKMGHITNYKYTNMGWLYEVEDNIGGKNKMLFDNEGNVTSLEDANQNITLFTFDEFGQTSVSTPYGRMTTTLKNNEGHTTQIDRPDGTSILFALDDNYNILTATYPTDVYSYIYNDNDQMKSMSNINGATTFEFDALSRPVKSTDPEANVVEQGFDAVGNNIFMVYPSGDTLKTEYNTVGLPTKISDWNGNFSNRLYNADGLQTSISNSNGSSTQIAYDDASKIEKYTNFDINSVIINQHNLTRLAGGLISKDSAVVHLQPNFSASVNNYVHNIDDEIQNTDSNSFTFDNNGRQITKAGINPQTAIYNEIDRVKSYTTNGITTTREHNPLGHITKQTVGTKTTKRALNMFGGIDWTLQEQSASNVVKATNIIAPDGLAWRLDSLGNASFFAFDYKGGTNSLTDTNGLVSDIYAYTPFGDFLNHTGNSTQPYIWQGRFGTTYEQDGHYQVRARDYNPTTARFWSRDALTPGLGNTQRASYIYGNNDPLRFVDYDGNSPSSTNSSSQGYSTARVRYYDKSTGKFDYKIIQAQNANLMSGNLPNSTITKSTLWNRAISNLHKEKNSFFAAWDDALPIITFSNWLTGSENPELDFARTQPCTGSCKLVRAAELMNFLGALEAKVLSEAPKLFGKRVLFIKDRMGRDGKAVEIFFTDLSKIDITSARVKEWTPILNKYPNSPLRESLKFKKYIPGTKGLKRIPTSNEINFLNNY